MTRAQWETEAREMADATGSDRWGSSTILRLMDLVFKREWVRILSANRSYRTATRTVTLDSSGQFAVSDLDGGSGDSAEVFYKVLGLHDGSVIYGLEELRDNLLTASLGTDVGTWGRKFWREGSNIQLSPWSNGESLSVVVNHHPPLPSTLSASSVAIDYPAGYEMILVLELAGMMLAKGGAETGPGMELKALAEDIRGDLLADVSRLTTDPTTFRYGDKREDWGG